MMRFLTSFFSVIWVVCVFAQRPEAPKIRYVSQDPFTDSVTIEWYKTVSPNIMYVYVEEIKQAPSEAYSPSFYVTTKNIDQKYTFHVDQLHEPDNVRLAVNAENSVDKSTGLSKYQSPAHIDAIVYKNCPSSFTISWTDYINPTLKLTGYVLYRVDGNKGTEIYRIGANDAKSYVYPMTTVGVQDACFYVGALLVENGNTIIATSGKKCQTVKIPRAPKFIRANAATTLDSHTVQLSFTLDTACDMKHYRLYASDSLHGTYKQVTGGDFAKISSPSLTYTDTTIDANHQRRFYKLYLIDSCGNQLMVSNVASNIVLTVNQGSRFDNDLKWTTYHDFYQGIKDYQVYKTIDKNPTKLLETTEPSNAEFQETTDDAETDAQTGATMCYFIVAEENPGTMQAYKSTSNSVCITRLDRIFIPDAFNPHSAVEQNRILKPSMSFVSDVDYEFTVIDRWGAIVFKTTDRSQGWDGKVNNAIVPPGTYVYRLHYTNSLGASMQKKGTVNVLY